jgi:hypothetical protein
MTYAALLCALYGLYLLAFRMVQRGRVKISLRAILLTAALFSVPLILAFPINATDVYRYFIRGRISSVHQESPFDVSIADLNNEPYRPLAGEWAGETSPYGPLWELTAAAISGQVQDDLWLALLLYKSLAAATHLIAAGLIWLSLSKVQPPLRAGITLLWAWNPALLLILAMDGHNDGLMIVWLLLGWWLMTRGRHQLGMIIMLLAPLTKPIGLLPLAYFFLACWQLLESRRFKARFLLITGLAGLALLWLSFLPFGSPLALAQRLLGEAASGGGFSPLALFILVAREYGADPSLAVSTRIATSLFVLFALWLVWKTWRGRSPLRAAADIFAGYIVQAFRFRIWYAIWLFPWLLLDFGRTPRGDRSSLGRLAAGLTLLLTSQLSALIYGQFRTELLGGSQYKAHLFGVFFTFLVPVLVGLAASAYSARPHERRRVV